MSGVMRKEKYQIVMEALRVGVPVEHVLKGYTIYLVENQICIIAKVSIKDIDDVEEKYLPVEYTLKHFLDDCDKLTDDQAFVLSANTAMTKMKQEKLQRREEAPTRPRDVTSHSPFCDGKRHNGPILYGPCTCGVGFEK